MRTEMQNNVHHAGCPVSQSRPVRQGNRGRALTYIKSLASDLMENLHPECIALSKKRSILTATGELMRSLLPVVLALFSALPVAAQDVAPQDGDALFFSMDEVDLSQFKWKKRPVVVFAESDLDPAFIEQMELLRARPDELIARDVVVITDTQPEPISDLRRKLRPRGFMLVIINKEGTVNVRKPFPWDVREISRTIDKMPIRKREIRDNKARAGEG